MDEVYNVYDKSGYIIGNGGFTAQQAAKIVGVDPDDFHNRMLNQYANGRNGINGFLVRRELQSTTFYKWTRSEQAEWDRTCKLIRERERHGKN